MGFTSLADLPRGAVVLIPFPFTDLSGAKQRPALLVSDPSAHSSSIDGHFVFLTTQPPPAHICKIPVVQGSPEANAMGLRFPPGIRTAHILPLKLATLGVCLVKKQIGTAPASLLEDVTRKIAEAIGAS